MGTRVTTDQNIMKTENGKVKQKMRKAFEVEYIQRDSRENVKLIAGGARKTIPKNTKSGHQKVEVLDNIGEDHSHGLNVTLWGLNNSPQEKQKSNILNI